MKRESTNVLDYEENKVIIDNVWPEKYSYMCSLRDCIWGFGFSFNSSKAELQYELGFYVCNNDDILYRFYKYGEMKRIPIHINLIEGGFPLFTIFPKSVRDKRQGMKANLSKWNIQVILLDDDNDVMTENMVHDEVVMREGIYEGDNVQELQARVLLKGII